VGSNDSDDSNYRIYITIVNTRIAGVEQSNTSEEITIRGAAFVEMDASQTRVNFYAIKMVEPEKGLSLRRAGLLTDVAMSPMIEERFKLYLEQLDLEARKRALE
jgi:hypothetical protein